VAHAAVGIHEHITVEPWEEREGSLFPGRFVRVRGVVFGTLPNKSNARKIVRFGDRPAIIKSAEARAWEKRFNGIALSGRPPKPLTGTFALHAVVYYDSMRRDLDIELLADALQRSGIIENDRAIWHKESTRRLDQDCPRVEFDLTPWEVIDTGRTRI